MYFNSKKVVLKRDHNWEEYSVNKGKYDDDSKLSFKKL